MSKSSLPSFSPSLLPPSSLPPSLPPSLLPPPSLPPPSLPPFLLSSSSEVLSRREAGDEVVEINVIQRVQLPIFPTKCSTCGRLTKKGKKLMRCSKCKAVGYCDEYVCLSVCLSVCLHVYLYAVFCVYMCTCMS